MKTNTIQVTLTSVFLGVIALIAITKSTVDFGHLAAGISYTAVALIAAVATVDYRRSKGYAAR